MNWCTVRDTIRDRITCVLSLFREGVSSSFNPDSKSRLPLYYTSRCQCLHIGVTLLPVWGYPWRGISFVSKKTQELPTEQETPSFVRTTGSVSLWTWSFPPHPGTSQTPSRWSFPSCLLPYLSTSVVLLNSGPNGLTLRSEVRIRSTQFRLVNSLSRLTCYFPNPGP